MPFTIVRQDITHMQVDAIVNAANPGLVMDGGVCGAIFQAAGPDKLQRACNKLAPIKTGEAAITPGYDLPAKFIIHAAGPIYRQGPAGQNERLLRSAYMASLKLALKKRCKSIAFPLLSSGTYGYPKDAALRVATSAIKDFLADHDMDIFLVVFDRGSFMVSEALLGAVESYIDETYVEARLSYSQTLQNMEWELSPAPMAPPPSKPQAKKAARRLDALMDQLDEPFNATLLRLIDAKGKTDAEVYKRANIDRKLFSKIRTGKGYMPGKRTILALAIALELSLEETEGLLKKAGYALSHSQKFDVIVEFFIVSEKYDIFEINEVLFQYDQPLLGAG